MNFSFFLLFYERKSQRGGYKSRRTREKSEYIKQAMRDRAGTTRWRRQEEALGTLRRKDGSREGGIPGGTLQRARQHGNVVKIKSN